MKITEWIWWKALKKIFLSFCLTDYPHKYGSEGGCADHSVFERMKKYQASAEEPARVSVIKNKRTRTVEQINTGRQDSWYYMSLFPPYLTLLVNSKVEVFDLT